MVTVLSVDRRAKATYMVSWLNTTNEKKREERASAAKCLVPFRNFLDLLLFRMYSVASYMYFLFFSLDFNLFS